MDEVKRNSLKLIIELAVQLPTDDCGMQLIHVVREFVDDDDLVEARAILKLIPTDYFSDYMYSQAARDHILANDIARLIEAFGYGFWLFARDAASA
jgi:hypothetical protein